MFLRTLRVLDLTIYLLLSILLLTASNPISNEPAGRARAFTRPIEFDYFNWSLEAALLKLQSSATGLPYYLDQASRKQVVMQYLFLIERIMQAENQLNLVYSNPSIIDKDSASAHLRAELEDLHSRQDKLTPLAESILQEQVSEVLADLGLTAGGQPIPPLLYHSSAVPMGLIISPRDHIEQLANISVKPDLSIDQQATLEDQVATKLDVSTLVVGIGGVGVYPTMVMRTTSLS